MVLSIRSSGMQGSKVNDDFMKTIGERLQNYLAEFYSRILYRAYKTYSGYTLGGLSVKPAIPVL
jgi:hypothetical protein